MDVQTLRELIEYFEQTPVGDISRPGRVLYVDVLPEDRAEILFCVTMDSFDRFVVFGGGLHGTGLYFTDQGPVLGRGPEVENFLEKLTSNVRFTQLIRGHGNNMVVSELEMIEFYTSIDDLKDMFDKKMSEIVPLA